MGSLYLVKTVNGHPLPDVVSALQKAIRRGNVDDALYWAVDMFLSGYHEYAWKRMRVIVSEDIGLADRHLPATFDALYRSFTELSKKKVPGRTPERNPFIHAVILLATAPKSRMVDHANIHHFRNHAKNKRPIPDYAYDKHTRVGRTKGRGIDHFFEEAGKLENEVGTDPYRQLAWDALKTEAKEGHDNHNPLFDEEKYL